MPLHDRIYRLLLRAFPAHFRESYEDEMTRAFGEMRRRDGAVTAWARSVPDIALAAPAAHARALSQDLRYAFRKVKHSPGTLALIAITLGAGVGANVAIYSMVDALLFRPMPVPDADTLVAIDRGAGVRETTSWLDYRDMRDRNSTFSQLTAWLSFPALVGEGGSAERRMCGLVAGNYFSTLGVRPLIGRFIEPEDDGAPGTGNVAVLSHSFWTRQYGADPQALGNTIEVNNRKFTIVGVAQEDFAGTSQPMGTDLWTPLSMHPAFLPGIQETDASRDSRWLFLHGRLKHGVTTAQAESNLNGIELQIQSEHPALGDTEEKRRDRVLRVSAANGIAVPHLRRAISRGGAFMLGVTGLLVLLSAVNVAGILLARAIARDREVALRIALGGSRRRIVRELLAESVLFGLAGAVAGVAAAYASLAFLNNLDMPMEGAWRWAIDARLDFRVLGYALAVSFAASLLFGLAPALQVTRADPQAALKEGSAASRGGRSGSRLRQLLAAGQFATAVTLLAATGLMVRSLNKMYDSPPGFDTSHQAYAYLILPGRAEDRPAFQKELRQRAAALPGVVSAALAENPPVRLGNFGRAGVRDPGREGRPVEAGIARVDSAYFSTVGIALIRGRAFTEQESARAVIVNQTLARQLWPAADPLGQRLAMGGDREEAEVVGVAADSKYRLLGEAPQPFLYRPMDPSRSNRVSVIVRTSGSPEAAVPALRGIVRQMDPTVDINRCATFSRALDEAVWPTRIASQFLSGFSAIGLLLAVSGLFGLMAHQVEQRRHEAGLRMAIGATTEQVTRLFLLRGAKLALAGIAVGVPVALALTRTMAGLVSGVSTADPLTYVGVAAVLLAAALAASWIPARRAARVDPFTALRQE